MAKLRFQTGGWGWGFRIDGGKKQAGPLCVNEDNSVAIKTLLKTTFLFQLEKVKSVELNGKNMTVIANDGTKIELRAKSEHLRELNRLISVEKKKGAA